MSFASRNPGIDPSKVFLICSETEVCQGPVRDRRLTVRVLTADAEGSSLIGIVTIKMSDDDQEKHIAADVLEGIRDGKGYCVGSDTGYAACNFLANIFVANTPMKCGVSPTDSVYR